MRDVEKVAGSVLTDNVPYEIRLADDSVSLDGTAERKYGQSTHMRLTRR